MYALANKALRTEKKEVQQPTARVQRQGRSATIVSMTLSVQTPPSSLTPASPASTPATAHATTSADAGSGTQDVIGVLYCHLGTPDAPTRQSVKRYLAQFLSDPRVVELPRLLWLPLLHGIILQVRPARSARKYASIWMPEGSPLKVWAEKQTAFLQQHWSQKHPSAHVRVRLAMRYGTPSIESQLDALQSEGATRILLLPSYPQYSATTTASLWDAVCTWVQRQRRVPELRWVGDYAGDAAYIAALANRIQSHWAAHGRSQHLLMSFHGIPARNVALGDPYQQQCLHTARLLAAALGLQSGTYSVTFQSRFGKARWLEPYTEPTLVALAQQGTKSVDVVCPGFVTDCLETLEEIAQEAREAFLHAGGHSFHYIPCLNDDPQGLLALAALTERHLGGWLPPSV